jgi:ribosome-binding factor A
MPSRRQEKVARVVKEVVSDALANHLSDPRIEGFISVTKVDVAPDMRNVDVFLSIFPAGSSETNDENAEQSRDAQQETAANKTFAAITHAKTRIQSMLARRMQSKYCPSLHFRRDTEFKKTLDTMRLIEQAAAEFRKHDDEEEQQ